MKNTVSCFAAALILGMSASAFAQMPPPAQALSPSSPPPPHGAPMGGPPMGMPPGMMPGMEHNMEITHAVHTLEDSKMALERSTKEYGGHRAKALEHINAALAELHQALESERHP